jgi:hypothetical protein
MESDESIDERAEDYVATVKDDDLQEAILYYEDEYDIVQDLMKDDSYRRTDTDDTEIYYSNNLRYIRRVLFYLHRRFFDGPTEDAMDEITSNMTDVILK